MRPSSRHALALALSTLAVVAVRAADPVDLDARELEFVFERSNPVEVTAFLGQWEKALGMAIVVDQPVRGIRLNFLSTKTKLTWAMAKKILDFHDVIVEEKEATPGSGRFLLLVHSRRSIPQHAGGPTPLVDVKKESLPQREQLITAVVQVIHGAGNDIYASVRSLAAVRDQNRVGQLFYVRGPEVFIIVDFAANVDYYVKIMRALDVPAPGQELRVRTLAHAPAQEVAQLLAAALKAQVVAQPMPGQPSGQPQVIPDPRTNKLLVQAFPYQFDEIDRLLLELDVKVPPKGGRFHLYKCRNAPAGYLQDALQPLLTGQGGGARPRSGRPGSAPPAPSAVTLAPQNGPQDLSRLETRIVADELTSSLLIQAEDDVYRQILALLEQLDRRRRVVAIEAQIWELSTPTDQLTLSVELAGLQNPHEGSYRGSALSNFGNSVLQVDPAKQTITRLPNLGQGLVAVLTKDRFDRLPVIVNALASTSRAKLLTRPFTVTNDNEEATFKIVQSVPYLVSNLTATGLSQQDVKEAKAESTLKVKPTVNGDDNLTLIVDLTLSSFGAQPAPSLPPTTNSRTYTGTVTIPSGKFVVFGGLEQETETVSEVKVPFVGDIPFLGHLFKSWTRNRSKNQVYIFIRPTVFQDDESHERATVELQERVHVAAERKDWVPALIPDVTRRTLHGEAFERFGSGSGNPFGDTPRDE